MARPLEQKMGADALRRATGRDHAQWRAVLTDEGAMEMSHSEIARHLVEQHGLDGWWAQGVAHDRVDPAKAALIALLEAAKTR